MLLFIKLCLLFLLASLSSKADCLPDHKGLCDPSVTITEDTQVEKVEDNKGTEIVTTTTTTKTTTTVTVTNEDSGNVLNLPDMAQDWGGEGPANMPSGNACYGLGTDTCAEITGSGNTTSNMGVDGMGTTFIQTVDISDLKIDNGGQVKYSIEVDKQDAEDRIYMHITGLDGNNQVFTGTDVLSESGISSGYQSYDGTFDFSGVLNRVTIEIGGRDINLAVGPVFDTVSLNVFYNVINTIITQQITSFEEIYYLNLLDTELNFAEEVFEFNDIKVDDVGKIEFIPIESPQEKITFETVEVEIQEEVDIVSIEMEETIEEEIKPVEEKIEEPVIEETLQEETQEEIKEQPTKEPSPKEKAATKIVKEIDDKSRYDEANQMKTLIVMQILGDTKTFFDTQVTLQDTNVNDYLLKSLNDPYGIMFDIAQQQTIDDMVNMQWQN